MKRLLALLLALMLCLSLLGGCAADPKDDAAQDTGATDTTAKEEDKTEEKEEEKTEDEAPVEAEPDTLSMLTYEAHGSYTLDSCMEYQTYTDMADHLRDNYGVVMDYTIVDSSVYESTLNGYLAAKTIPDIFYSGLLAADVVNNCIDNGIFADMDEVLAYSDGTASGMLLDGGTFNFIKGMNTKEDGHWYTCHTAASAYTNIDLDDAETDYICEFPIGCFYGVQIRYDWLQKLGLSVPSTTAEYKEALVRMREEDANGNGAKDERAFLCLGNPNEPNSVYIGIGGWYGLTNGNFVVSVDDGSIDSAILQGDQYIQFANFMGELYDANVVYVNEGAMWNRGVEAASNVVSSYQQYPNNTHNELTTGAAGSFYYPISVIQAIEGVNPTLQGQASVVGYTAYAFDAEANYDACARWMDFIHSEFFFEMLYFGCEGTSWDWAEDGTVTSYDLTEDELLDYRGMWTYMTWTAFPQVDTSIVYHYNAQMYKGIQAAIDNGEPYTNGGFKDYADFLTNSNNASKGFTEEGNNLYCYFIDLLEFGVENIDWTMAATFTTANTANEMEVIGKYEGDIKTYVDELNLGYITGQRSTDTYEEDIQYAYDNLGLQEYIDALQAASNRYLVAVGRDPIE